MTPGLILTVVVLTGVAIGVAGPLAALDLAALALALASVSLLVARPRARRMVVLASVLFAAAWDGAAARDRAVASPLVAWFETFAPDDRAPDAVLVHGALVDDASPTDSGVRLLIDLESIRAAGAWRAMAGRVQAHVSGDLASAFVANWTAGRTVAAPVILRRPQSWQNPGSPSERWQQLHRTVDLVGTIKSGSLVAVGPAPWWDEAAARVRQHVRDAARHYVAPRSLQSAAIVAAILIGDRAGLADDVQRRLQAAGTYHVIAISGGNVAILTSVCFVLLRLVIRSFRAVALITMTAVIAYGWLVGDQPSVRRAVTAACIYLGLSLIGLMPRALNVLGVTSMSIAVTDPLTVVDAGAWLSFGATLGIIVGAARFMRWAIGDSPPVGRRTDVGPATGGRKPDSRHERAARTLRKIWLAILGLFSATLAAELVLVPVSAAVFSRLSLLGLVLNFIAIPAMTVVQLSGFVATAFAGWWDGGAAMAGWVADMAAWLLVSSSTAVDIAPWLVWRVPPTSPLWTVTFYAGLAAAVWQRGSRWPRRLAIAATVASFIIIVTAPGLEWSAPPMGRLRVTMLDVGQGDSLLVQFPEPARCQVDQAAAVLQG